MIIMFVIGPRVLRSDTIALIRDRENGIAAVRLKRPSEEAPVGLPQNGTRRSALLSRAADNQIFEQVYADA